VRLDIKVVYSLFEVSRCLDFWVVDCTNVLEHPNYWAIFGDEIQTHLPWYHNQIKHCNVEIWSNPRYVGLEGEYWNCSGSRVVRVINVFEHPHLW